MDTENSHYFQVLLGTGLSLISAIAVILYTDPFSASLITHLIFYLSLFFFTTGFVTFAELVIRKSFFKKIKIWSFWDSFRHGLLMGILVIASLMLQAQDLLHWWVLIGLVLFLSTIELLFSS